MTAVGQNPNPNNKILPGDFLSLSSSAGVKTELKEKPTIAFFGDSRELYGSMNVIYFAKDRTVCDYTECGIYVASKVALREKPKIMTLKQLIEVLREEYGNVNVKAWNNGFAITFRERNIKTLSDLEKAIKEVD